MLLAGIADSHLFNRTTVLFYQAEAYGNFCLFPRQTVSFKGKDDEGRNCSNSFDPLYVCVSNDCSTKLNGNYTLEISSLSGVFLALP